jgi:hypothetical protein
MIAHIGIEMECGLGYFTDKRLSSVTFSGVSGTQKGFSPQDFPGQIEEQFFQRELLGKHRQEWKHYG